MLTFYSVFTGSSALPVAAIVTVAVCICFGFTFRVALIKSFFLVKYSASFGGPAIQSFVVHDIVRPSHSCGRCQAKHERECVGGGGGGGCGDRGRCHFDQEQKGVIGTKKQHLRPPHRSASASASVLVLLISTSHSASNANGSGNRYDIDTGLLQPCYVHRSTCCTVHYICTFFRAFSSVGDVHVVHVR